ncbi:ester cyclase [Deinococcus roseus]|uniref:Ester cyclase n=1 Tax=Deinococcus roseus TaxID=392414 RepID=A0ABQ2D2I5_9DEIO|nr:ester cyclase [Deinococcus roseus]GGJ43344.1 hypothetical protein GCM10008938_32040 [Deinococcus roseus]
MDHQHMRKVIRQENEEMWHGNNPDVFQDSSHPHRVTHTLTFGDVVGHDAHGQLARTFQEAFSEHKMRIDHLVVEGDHAAYRIIHHARHTGTFLGIAPTGNEVTISMANFARFEGDKIAELWTMWDTLTLLKQIGVEGPLGPR